MWTWAIVILAFGLALLWVRVKKARRRGLTPNRASQFVDRQKIIIALEINEFLVKYSHRQSVGYLPLSIEDHDNWVFHTLKKWLKYGHFYKPLFTITKIRSFVQGLADIGKVELMLYSSMPPAIADAILVKLQIDRIFPKQKRKFCDLENDDDQKHAIQVDQDSRRVIIVTPSYDDHTFEDERYFLVMRPKTEQENFLRDSLKSLKLFVENNQDLDMLHEELGAFRVDVESDWSESEF